MILLMLDSLPVLLITIKDIFASEKISLEGLNTLGLLDELISEEQNQVQRNAQVSSDEVLVVEVAVLLVVGEGGKVLGKGNETAPEEREVRAPDAQGCGVGQLLGGNALSLTGAAEVDVGDEDGDPGEETEDGSKVNEVTENLLAAGRDVHVCQETEQSRGTEGVVRNTTLVSLGQDLGCLATESKTVKSTTGNVKIGVAGTEDEDQDASVQESGKTLDTSKLDGDDEWRGSSRVGLLGGESELVAVVGDDHTDQKDRQDVEEDNTEESQSDSLKYKYD